jgi:glycosyltransferase involved in cell wall biosynthesis
LTVTIVTYNGGDRLPLVLEKLRSQINTEGVNWDILIVDNNSNNYTKTVIQSYQNQAFPVPIKYIFEPQQGAGFARKRAIQATNAPLIGFLDDDNLPADNWVVSAYKFAQEYPKAGAYGSQIHGDYDIEPPANFERIKAFLAITERGDQPLLYNPKSRFLPPSAGLVVRRQAWLENVPETCILTGRVAGTMLTSEDLEVLSYLQQSSWEIWYNPQMKVWHKIAAHRLTREYLIPHLGGIGLSRYVTRTVGVKPILKPLLVLAYLFNDCRKLSSHILKYGIHPDTVATAERELLRKSLISPFYFGLKNPLQTPKR